MIFSPDYAEMHYKFKLPWSLLYKKEPEIIVDAPFQVVPEESVKLFLVVREANRFPFFVETVTANFFCGNFQKETSVPVQEEIETPFRFLPIDCGKFPPGKYRVEASVEIRIGKRKKTVKRFNLTGLKPTPLEIRVLRENVPKPEGFIAGDVHAHTYYSADPVEFGASPEVLQQAAKMVGLDFVFCTDHSYDFAYQKDDYMLRADAEARYKALRNEILTLDKYPEIIPGEEISAGNRQGKNVHLLLPGHPSHIPGDGDCGRNWLKNAPTLSIPQIVEMTKLPCFAAHPKERMGNLERFVFRRGDWEAADLQRESGNPIRGIEFWNGSRDAGFALGRKFWISELEKGNYVLPLGGNDAHGDLNEYTGVKIPLFKLKRSRAHVFGYVRTVISGKNPVEAFRGMNLYVTDGPALWWECENGEVLFRFKSSEDFGKLEKLTVFAQGISGGKERPVEILPQKTGDFECACRVSPQNFRYVRAEAETVSGRFALTSACPAKPGNAHTGTSQPDSCCR